jgi:hypothetical protein
MAGVADVIKKRQAQKWERERLKREREADTTYQRELGKQMGDMEFQMEIAPYLNYKGPIDPDVARIRQTPHRSNLRGYYVPHGYQYGKDEQDILGGEERRVTAVSVAPDNRAEVVKLPAEDGTVNAVNAENWNPRLWAHEYRHKQSLEPISAMPRIDELSNRLMDAYNAQNIKSFRDTADNIEGGYGIGTEELINILRDMAANKEREVERWNSIKHNPETGKLEGDFYTETVRPYENLQPYLVDNPLFMRILGAKNGN